MIATMMIKFTLIKVPTIRCCGSDNTSQVASASSNRNRTRGGIIQVGYTVLWVSPPIQIAVTRGVLVVVHFRQK